MANKETENCEKFKTMIGGQALIEGIMMRGPEKDAIVIRGKDGLTVEVSPRKLNPPGSWKNWELLTKKITRPALLSMWRWTIDIWDPS